MLLLKNTRVNPFSKTKHLSDMAPALQDPYLAVIRTDSQAADIVYDIYPAASGALAPALVSG